jgi:hypothetical protein
VTLVLTHTSRDYAIQVSDRRLTWPDGTLADDKSNKAVVWGGSSMFAYTGFARLDAVHTDLWLAQVLLSCTTLDDAEAEIATQASRAVKRIGVTPLRRWHAFVGVTWIGEAPVVLSISNFQDDQGKWRPDALERFTVVRLPLVDKSRLHIAGQRLSETEEDALTSRITELLTRDAEPSAIADRLLGEVRRVATTNERVGSDVLVSSLPRLAVASDGGWESARPTRTGRASYYVPAKTDSPVTYGPTLAGGGVAIGRPEIWTSKPPWWTH